MSEPSKLPFDPIDRAAGNWEGHYGDSRRMRLATSVMRVHQLLLNTYDEAMRTHGLTFARFEALALLRFSKSDQLPMKVIGDRLQVHPTSVTNIIERLTAAGLVERSRNPKDGRGILASLTDEGRRVVDAAAADLMAIDFALTDLGDADTDAVTAIFTKLRGAAGDFPAGDDF